MSARGVLGTLTLVGVALLAACSGGGGGSNNVAPAPAHATATPGPTASPVGTSTPGGAAATARVVITEPAPAASSAAHARASRRPLHLPASTKTIAITVNGGTPTTFTYVVDGPTCVQANTGVTTCTYDVNAPSGSDTIVVQALDGTNLLATATAIVTISGTTSVPVTLAGVPASVTFAIAHDTAPAGTATTIPISVTAYDADANPIAGAYSSPVSLTDGDTSGHTSLSPSTVASSTQSAELQYDGHVVNAKITSPLSQGMYVEFASGIAAQEYAIPSGTAALSNAGTGTIVLGGDGAMWFGEQNGVGRVTANGSITEYPMVQPQRMVTGADGAVWFTTYYDASTGNSGELCRVAAGGTVSKLNLNLSGEFVLGSDGNFWNVNGNASINRITPQGVVTTFPLTGATGALNAGVYASDVLAAPNGNLVVIDYTADALYTVTTSGTQVGAVAMSPFPVSGGSLTHATFGSDGAIWYTSQDAVVRVTQAGAVTENTAIPGSFNAVDGLGFVTPIDSGPDQLLYATGSWLEHRALFRVAPGSSTILALPLPDDPAPNVFGQPYPAALANGPNGTVWYVRGSSVGVFTPPT